MIKNEKESSLLKYNLVKLRIISQEAKEKIIEVPNDTKIDKLKALISQQFFGTDSSKNLVYYSLVSVRLGHLLKDENTIQQCGLVDKDEILLTKRSLSVPTRFGTRSRSATPTSSRIDMDSIEKATAHLSSRNSERRVEPIGGEVQFTKELRPILVSLVDAAQKILCLSKDAAHIFNQVQEQLSESRSMYPEAEEGLTSQLVEMGFQRARSAKALRLTSNVLSDATEWLISHENDQQADDPLVDAAPLAGLRETLGQLGTQADSADDSDKEEVAAFVEPMSPQLTLELFRTYNRRQFRPNERARGRLMEMGFDESSAVDALRLFGNDEGQALDHLLSPDRDDEAVDDLEGLPADSPLWKAITSDPTVQLGLTYPTSLFAFLNILDNPRSTMDWLNNQEIGPMLCQVSRIFYSELKSKTPLDHRPSDYQSV